MNISNDELINIANEQSRTIAVIKAQIAELTAAMEEIATSHNHLDDEAMEETHGTVAMVQRRLARITIAKAGTK
jgi:hypothetical protein